MLHLPSRVHPVTLTALFSFCFFAAIPAWGASAPPFRVPQLPTNGQQPGPIATLGNGYIAIPYQDLSNPALFNQVGVSVFDTNGVRVGAEIIDPTALNYSPAAVAGSASNTFWVVSDVFDLNNPPGMGNFTRIIATLYTVSGNTVTRGVVKTIVDDSFDGSDDESVSVARLANGNYVVAWGHTSADFGSGSTQTRTFDSNFAPLSPRTTISSGATSTPFTFEVSVTSNGTNVDVTYKPNSNTGIYGVAFTVNSGGAISGISAPVNVSAALGGNQSWGHQELPDGTIVVLYNTPQVGATGGDMYGAIFGAGFSGTPSTFLIATGTPVPPNGVYQPVSAQATLFPNGGFIVTYARPTGGHQAEIYARFYDSNHAPLTNEFLVTVPQGTPANGVENLRPYVTSGVAGGGGLAIAWMTMDFTASSNPNTDVYARVYADIGPTSSGGTSSLAAALEDSNPTGASVSSLITGNQYKSMLNHPFAGVAVVGNAATAPQGQWQYSSNAGASWSSVATTVSATNATIIGAGDLIRFQPSSNWNGTPGALTVRVWDGQDGFVADSTAQNISQYIFDTSGITQTTASFTGAFAGTTVFFATSITAVNDAPMTTGSAVTLTAINEDTLNPAGQAVSSAVAALFSDATDAVAGGSSANTLAGIAISGNAEAGEGTWQWFNGSSFVNVGTSVSNSSALILAAGTTVRFVPALNFNGAAPQLTARLIDNSSGAVTAGSTVNFVATGTGGTTPYSAATFGIGEVINPVNDPPVLVNTATPVAATEQTAALLSSTITVSDVELDALNGGAGDYAGATLTVARLVGQMPEDVFGFDPAGAGFTISSGNLQSGGLSFGSFTSGSGVLNITFTSSGTAATQALVRSVLQHITYTNTSDDPPATVSFTYVFHDGNTGSQGSGGTLVGQAVAVVNIAGVNDAPWVTVPLGIQTALKEADAPIVGIVCYDLDAGAGSITATLFVSHGTLNVVASGGASITGNSTGTLTISGTLTQVNTALTAFNNFLYHGNAGYTGVDQVSINVNDNGNTGAGGPLQAQGSITLYVVEPVTVTSGNLATFTVGLPGTFTVTTSASFPTAALSEVGALPAGVTFVDNGDGTATLSGTPGPGTGGVYPLVIAALNGVPPVALQNFTLSVNQAPTFTSANAFSFVAGQLGQFYVTTGPDYPTATTLTCAEPLPIGLHFHDLHNGTAFLVGIANAGTGGVYTLHFTASNGVAPDATQTFTLTVYEAPTISSVDSATFTAGVAGTFTVTTAHCYPVASFMLMPSLPAGLNFVDAGDGTATISGTPASGFSGIHPQLILANNGVSPLGAQTLILTINEGPSITSNTTTTFTVGSLGQFTITTGLHFPLNTVLSCSGALPAGVHFIDDSDGTGRLIGIPSAGTGGAYSLTLTASNGIVPDGTQTFTLVVREAPRISSADTAMFTASQAGTFTITTDRGYPAPALSITGALPSGVSCVDAGNGTATLSGTPAAGTGGVYSVTITAQNGISSNATQNFTLTVNEAPSFTSANAATFVAGAAHTFTVTTGHAYPAAVTVSSSGTLPTGVTFTDNGNGTATLAGTPADGTGGLFSLPFTASNGIAPDATQNFILTVNEAPTITSANGATFAVGSAGSFTITTGHCYPVPALSQLGFLIPNLSVVDRGDGTATLSGTPAAETAGVFTFTLVASNGVAPDAHQVFFLIVNVPTITVSPTTLKKGTVGTPYSQTVSAAGAGSVAPYSFAVSSGALPGGLNLSSAGVISGTPTTKGVFTFTVQATDSSGGSGPYQGASAVTILIDERTPPVVTQQPSGISIFTGMTATLTVAASGQSLSYQWYQGGSGDTSQPVAGATGNAFTTPAQTVTTSYWVRVSNSGGFTDSNAALVTVVPPPLINGGSPSGEVGTGGPIINAQMPFSVDVPGGTTVTWNFGDGSTATGSSAIHIYTAPGTYTVTTTLTDPSGQQTAQTSTIVIKPTPMRITSGNFILNSGNDRAILTGLVHVAGGSVLNQQTVTVDVGGNVQTFTLNARGQGRSGASSFSLRARMKGNSKVTADYEAPIKIVLSGELGTALRANSSLDAQGFPTRVTVLVQFNGGYFGDSAPLKFKVGPNGVATAKGKF